MLHALQSFATQKGVHIGPFGLFGNFVAQSEQLVDHPGLPPFVLLGVLGVTTEHLVVASGITTRGRSTHGAPCEVLLAGAKALFALAPLPMTKAHARPRANRRVPFPLLSQGSLAIGRFTCALMADGPN